MVKKQICVGADYLNRNGSKINLQGIDLFNFIKNPVLLADHENECSEVIGKWFPETWTIRQLNGNDFCFMDCEIVDESMSDKVEKGILKGISMGLFIKEWTIEENGTDGWFLKILKSELGEVSLCAIPAIPDAVIDNPMFNFSIGSQANDTKPKTSKISKEDFKAKIESELEKNKHYLKFNFDMSKNSTQNTSQIKIEVEKEDESIVNVYSNKDTASMVASFESTIQEQKNALAIQKNDIEKLKLELLQKANELNEAKAKYDKDYSDLVIAKEKERLSADRESKNLHNIIVKLNVEKDVFLYGSAFAKTVLSSEYSKRIAERFMGLHEIKTKNQNGVLFFSAVNITSNQENDLATAVEKFTQETVSNINPNIVGNAIPLINDDKAKELDREREFEACKKRMPTNYAIGSAEYRNYLIKNGFGDKLNVSYQKK